MTTTATTPTTAPQTSEEARRLLVNLEQREAELAARKREAAANAKWDACQSLLALADGPLKAALRAAEQEWNELTDPSREVDLFSLFTAWITLTSASAERAAAVAQANATMNSLRPRRTPNGAQTDYRGDTHDTLAGALFSRSLDDLAQRRRERLHAQAVARFAEPLQAAADAAAEETL
ncbi:MAG: hypothetical protein WAW82_08450 [Candidatus Lutibacillus vidarii]|jgi:hypothetical protein